MVSQRLPSGVVTSPASLSLVTYILEETLAALLTKWGPLQNRGYQMQMVTYLNADVNLFKIFIQRMITNEMRLRKGADISLQGLL